MQRAFCLPLPLAALLLACPAPAAAQYVKSKPDAALSVETRQASTIMLARPAKKVFVAAPEIADVDATNAGRITVYGKKPGTTTIIISDAVGGEQIFRIRVERPIRQMLAAAQAAVPAAQINIVDRPDGVTITGEAAHPADADAIKAAVRAYLAEADKLDFRMRLTGSVQVNLRIRIAEVSRRVSSAFGINWGAATLDGTTQIGLLTGRLPTADVTVDKVTTRQFARSEIGDSSLGVRYRTPSGNTDIAGLIDALKAEGLATILAEPNLTTSSGSRANFLAGGEFPVPMSTGQGDNARITVEWKPFGVRVDFTPVVLDENRMTIKVNSEVSELSSVGAVKVNNISIPSVSVRRVDTTVDLASGQSFAIAGLFKKNAGGTMNTLPGLGEIPIIGALFRSKSFQRDESELVIMVTPYIVRPVDQESAIKLPTDNVDPASDLQQILLGKMTKQDVRKLLDGPPRPKKAKTPKPSPADKGASK